MTKTYTVKQVADALGFSTNTVYKYLEEGKIRATRLGGSGRFKISQSEVSRLLGSAPVPTALQAPVAPTKTALEIETEVNQIIPQKDTLAKPQLFDWLLSLSAIFIGVTILTNPIKYAGLSEGSLKTIFLTISALLSVLGSLLFVSETLPLKHLISFNRFSRIFLAIFFASLAGLLLLVGHDNWSASYIGIYCLFTLFSFLPRKHQSELITIAFLGTLVMATAFSFSFNTDGSGLGLSSITNFYITPSIRIVIALTGLIATICLMIAFKTSRILFSVLSFAASAFFMLMTINFINSQMWMKTISSLLAGCFAFLLPFAHQLETFGSYTKKQLAVNFLWIVATISMGIVAIKINQTASTQFISSAVDQSNQNAGEYASKYILDASSILSRATSDDRLIKSAITASNSAALTDNSKNIYFSTSAFRRIFFADATGNSFSAYPPLANTSSISDRDYFIQTKNTLKPTISSILIPRNNPRLGPTVYITYPIIDGNGLFKGVIVGAIDSTSLHDQLVLMTKSESAQVIVTDATGNKLFTDSNIDSTALNKPGRIAYGPNQELFFKSQTNIDKLDWTLTSLLPYNQLFKQSNYVSILVFFVCASLGIGSLLLTKKLSQIEL